jgi:hypothetical protein
MGANVALLVKGDIDAVEVEIVTRGFNGMNFPSGADADAVKANTPMCAPNINNDIVKFGDEAGHEIDQVEVGHASDVISSAVPARWAMSKLPSERIARFVFASGFQH